MAEQSKVPSQRKLRARAVVGELTRQQILDAAERLFAEQGPEAVSIRGIASAANVNLAAVNYHFGSKERLFEELFRRLVVPLNERRLSMLDEVLRQADAASIEAILEAFVTAPLSLAYEAADSARSIVVMQFLSHSFSKPGEVDFLNTYYDEVRFKFINALSKVLPHLSINDVVWRYNFIVGGIIYAMGGASRMTRVPKGLGVDARVPHASAQDAIAQLVTMAADGLRARSLEPKARLKPHRSQPEDDGSCDADG